MSDVGAALTGKYPDFRHSQNIEDRRDEPWPTANVEGNQAFLPVTPTLTETAKMALDLLYALDPVRRPIPPATRLGIDAGIHDLGTMNAGEAAAFMNGGRSK